MYVDNVNMYNHVLNAIKNAKSIAKLQKVYTIKYDKFEVQIRKKSDSVNGFDDINTLTGSFVTQDDSLAEQKRVVFEFHNYKYIKTILERMDTFIINQENNNLNDDMAYFEDALNGH